MPEWKNHMCLKTMWLIHWCNSSPPLYECSVTTTSWHINLTTILYTSIIQLNPVQGWAGDYPSVFLVIGRAHFNMPPVHKIAETHWQTIIHNHNLASYWLVCVQIVGGNRSNWRKPSTNRENMLTQQKDVSGAVDLTPKLVLVNELH